jgi:hypothetical protein
MKFSALMSQAIARLQREGRVSYQALKRKFELDKDLLEDLEDLKEELLFFSMTRSPDDSMNK